MIHYNKKLRALAESTLLESKNKSPEYWKVRRALQSKRPLSLAQWAIDSGYEIEINIHTKKV